DPFTDDLEQYLDEKILRLKDEMNIAAQLDIDTLNKRIETGDTSLIAMQKVKLLPKVVSVLSKANLADTILDNNLLQSVRIWLEPLPDGSLPSFEIQKSLFAALNDLPVKTEHLKESGLGRVVIFYTKSKRVEAQLARLAEKLIAEWTRPIIG
uniref:Transcription factor IWS1 n=1 Tax=Saccharomyces cerevisiae TaxID=4932 RepID=UPI0001E9295F|nr:Chain A, Transcription factor IWS1 [Saccharomyces cerevisiae]